MVEWGTVNALVVGSNPTSGAIFYLSLFLLTPFCDDLEPDCFGFFFSLRCELLPFPIIKYLLLKP